MKEEVILTSIMKLLIIVPFYSLFVLCIIAYFLTRSILRILREVAPEVEKELAVHTGFFLIDNTFWVRPWKFRKFVYTKRFLDDPRLERRLAQYKLAYGIFVGVWIYFAVLALALLVRFVFS